MLDHVSLGVIDLDKSLVFYEPTLKALGLTILFKSEQSVAFGEDYPEFWIGLPVDGKAAETGNGAHICFRADSQEAVDQFYDLGMKNGGADAGNPGLRPEYVRNYYAAFLFDPDGSKIEAVCYIKE